MATKPLVYTKEDLLKRVKESDKAYADGKLIPASVVLAELREKYATIPA